MGSKLSAKPAAVEPWLTASDKAVLVFSTLFKISLWPTYHSTDFEVHRNWLAITRTLPIRDWYFEATSEWTLDYPPFFAYFSWLLALPAPLVDPLIVSLHEGLDYAEPAAKYYMRATVMVTELVYGAALVALSRHSAVQQDLAPAEDSGSRILLSASLFLHPGLIIIDHIHFQYNGFLFGVLLWSVWAIREKKPLLAAVLFSSLLNLKHIYVYVAPAYFVFLLRAYVYPPGSTTRTLPVAFERMITLGAFTLAPFAASLLPLMLSGIKHESGSFGVLSQMVSRLFPFSRGLNHAYWAPNFWALYTAADRVLLQVVRRNAQVLKLLPSSLQRRFQLVSAGGFASASRGLIGNVEFALLPNITPRVCFVITAATMVAYMTKLWRAPTYKSFLSCLTLCGYTSFLFGWHVHEKAILLVLLPLTYLSIDDFSHFRAFALLSISGCVSLFPLLFQPAETPIKLAFTAIWLVVVLVALSQKVYRPVPSNVGLLFHGLENVYLAGFPLLLFYTSLLHPLLFRSAPSAAAAASGTSSAMAAHVTAAYTNLKHVAENDLVSTGGGFLLAASQRWNETLATMLDAVTAPASITAEPEVSGKLDFLPLMLMSVYCGIGVVWIWVKLSLLYLQRDFSETGVRISKTKRE